MERPLPAYLIHVGREEVHLFDATKGHYLPLDKRIRFPYIWEMKQKWLVMLELTETEGQNSPEPWYNKRDIENLIRIQLARADFRDIELESIQAKEQGGRYY